MRVAPGEFSTCQMRRCHDGQRSRVGPLPTCWRRRHLLGLEGLTAEEITAILDKAEIFKGHWCLESARAAADGRDKLQPVLRELDADADQLLVGRPASGGRHNRLLRRDEQPLQGRTVIDTAKDIEAMGADVMVVRHRTPGTPHLLAQNLNCCVINAGDGPHEHPTRGCSTSSRSASARRSLSGLTVAWWATSPTAAPPDRTSGG